MDAPARLETARLAGHRVAAADFGDLRDLYRDRRIMATLSADGQPLDDPEIRGRLARFIGHWSDHGFGIWHFRALDNKAFVGRAGLHRVRVNDADEIELLYAVMPLYWRTGMACEAARAAVDVAFKSINAPSIIAYALPHNHGSRRVMEKLGLVYERDFIHAELPHVLYRLTREGWRANQ